MTRISAGLPSPRLRFHDPWALRALVAVMMVAAYVAAGDERMLRVAAAFDWNGVLSPANIRVDAWVTPPAYTGKPPIILSAANKEAATPAAGPLPVPAGSTLIVRSSGGTLDVVAGGGLTEAVPAEQAPKGTNERHFTIAGDGTAHVRAPSGQPQWKFSAVADRAPTIALSKDPERQARGSLQLSYKIEDDYGVTEAQARFALRPGEPPKGASEKSSTEPRPLFDPPQFSLMLPNARTRNGMREVVANLWALAVTIEDGNITDVDKALRAAQEALKQALERGASDEEIKKLTENLRAALDNFMRQLAEQLRNNPQQLARPLAPNTTVLRQQDLNNTIERMQRLSPSDDKDAAKQLLEQLQQMLGSPPMPHPDQP